MIERLPHWIIPNKIPAFLEGESGTAIEMVAKVYGKTNELIADYNEFVDAINTHIEDFENSVEKNYELFTVSIRQEFQDFIDLIELKMQSQDKEIEDAINYMKKNLNTTVTALVEKALEDGVFTIGLHYNEETHGLNISLQGVV